LITFESVTKRYPGGTVAVDDLDLQIPDGQTMVLVGPSGCGKTTSLRMINRLIDPSEGRIMLDGTDISTVEAPQLRRGIGYVIQQAGLFPHRTIEDNIATVPLLEGWNKAKARDRARELMDLVGLDQDMARRYPYQLSGGQQQRVGVARALAADPPVLLMDEPFSAVDPIVRNTLQDELIRLQAELHKTVVLVTHDVEEAIKVGDQVAVFYPHGKIAQLDTPQHLLGSPADEYVENFLGFDRGIRRLAFFSAGELQLETGTVLPGDTSVEQARAAASRRFRTRVPTAEPRKASPTTVQNPATASWYQGGGDESRANCTTAAAADTRPSRTAVVGRVVSCHHGRPGRERSRITERNCRLPGSSPGRVTCSL